MLTTGDRRWQHDAVASRPFDHVLLTRFSAVLVPGAPPPDEAWLRYRLAFFYDACLPSVLSQRDAEFEWLVLLDDRCSDGFRSDVEDLAPGAFVPVWTHEPFRRASFAEPVAARCGAPYLISTRLDSDDAIAVDLMASVQARFAGQERLFVNFPRGIQVDRSGAVYRTDIVSSPFLSLVERREAGRPPATVYVAKHARARQHAPLLQVRAPVMWAQVLHDDNVSNIVNGRQTHPRVVADRFAIDLGYDARLAGARLRRAQVRQLGRLLGLWVRHPGELTKWVEATWWTSRGTRLWPQGSGVTLSDRARAVALAPHRWRRVGRRRRGERRRRAGAPRPPA